MIKDWICVEGSTGTLNYVFANIGEIIFLGSDQGLAFSSDNGSTWSQTSLYNIGIESLAVCSSILFALTPKGIFKSFDVGRSWEIFQNITIHKNRIISIISNSKDLVVATECEVYVFPFGNNDFKNISESLPIRKFQFIATKGEEIFGFQGHYNNPAYKFDYRAEKWIDISKGINSDYSGIRNFAIIGNKLFVVSYNDIVYEFNDELMEWNVASTSVTKYGIEPLIIKETKLFAATENGNVYHSHNSGVSWKEVNSPFIERETSTSYHKKFITFFYHNECLFAGLRDVGVYRSKDNGSSWEQVNNGLAYNDPKHFAVIGNRLFASNDGTQDHYPGIYLSEDNGITWIKNETNFVGCNGLCSIGTNLFAVNYKKIVLSTDYGKTWDNVTPNNMEMSVDFLSVDNNILYAGARQGVFMTPDLGYTWFRIGKEFVVHYISCLAVNGKNIFIGTKDDGFYWTNDNGDNWSDQPDTLTEKRINCVVIKSNNVYVGTWSGVYISSDNGRTWKEFNKGWATPIVEALIVHDNILYAGTWGGVYLLEEPAESWIKMTDGAENIGIVYALAVCGKYLFRSGNGGLWRMSIGLK